MVGSNSRLSPFPIHSAQTQVLTGGPYRSPIDKYIHDYDHDDQNCSAVPTTIDFSSLVDHLTADQMCHATDDHAKQQMLRETEDTFRACGLGARELDGIKPHTSLDDSQLEALRRIVSKELAIVQGPPGTGKTFTSVQSIKVLLRNRQPGDPPIIVAAQTNHALDQLLIHCLASGANMMRVGGRTENEEIAKRTMYELRRTVMGKLPTHGQYGALEKQRRKITQRFENLVNDVFGGEEAGLLDAQTLLDAGVISQSQHDSLTEDGWEGDDDIPAMETWLGEEKIKRIQQRIDDLDFEGVEAADETVELEDIDNPTEDDEDRIHGTFVKLSSNEQLTGQTPQTTGWQRRARKMLLQKDNLFDIPIGIRGGVYQILQSKLRESASGKFHEILKDATNTAQRLKICSWTRDLHVIDKHCIDIVGCTTTGLTKYRGFLAAMKPRTLLIEEAAETREANITSALYPSIQQLILIGDHQQLPPSCDIQRLAKEPYNLNLSLFERLVKNGLPFTMLNLQRRMAPELSHITKKFYPELMDHDLVKDINKRPLIPGMGDRRSFFLTHSWPEDTDADNSKYNKQEVEMVVAFIRYLLLNGVKATEITVLTYYKGQRRKIIQRLRHKDIPINNFFKVTTVDSYQGEENEIVILSLVRSPQPGRNWNVGFCKFFFLLPFHFYKESIYLLLLENYDFNALVNKWRAEIEPPSPSAVLAAASSCLATRRTSCSPALTRCAPGHRYGMVLQSNTELLWARACRWCVKTITKRPGSRTPTASWEMPVVAGRNVWATSLAATSASYSATGEYC